MTMKFNPKARAEQIAAQLKAAQEMQDAYDQNIETAVKHAGRTRAEFVEMLYDLFDIGPEKTPRMKDGQPVKDKRGETVMVSTDKDESIRIGKLAAKFEVLVNDFQRRQREDPDRGERA
ncbi:hypothetical protein [Nesterenkonia sp. Act20]|uniref:hypothetical protein n=1 Tax=Nesterenkonia sp. Act20 TaxID=1483432 RepID=UPI001C46D563|nr:hypothetical protein [Nesterenkonia sp. Act20]